MSDNNSHTMFTVPDPDAPMGTPLVETHDITDLAQNLVPGDYEGSMSVTIVATGDVIEVEVSFHITTDGLVDVEAI